MPKTIQQQIKEHVILSVAIKDYDNDDDYVGTGVIKKVQVMRGDPYLTVILQIDVMQPLDKRKRQNPPDQDVRYARTLDFRVRYDSQNIHG